MEKLIFNLPYNEKLIHLQFVKFLNFAIKLTDQEQLVLAKLIEYNLEYIILKSDKRAKFIMSSSIKKEMSDSLDFKVTGFNQVLIRLKKKVLFNKPILTAEGELNNTLLLLADNEGMGIEINFLKSLTKKVKEEVKEVKEETLEKNNEDKVIVKESPKIISDKHILIDEDDNLEIEIN